MDVTGHSNGDSSPRAPAAASLSRDVLFVLGACGCALDLAYRAIAALRVTCGTAADCVTALLCLHAH